MLAIVMAKPFLHCPHRFKNGKDHCYWRLAEKVRTARGWVQRHILYLGEINDSQREAWTKVTDVFDTRREQTRPLALYPADRAVPEHASEYGVQVLGGVCVAASAAVGRVRAGMQGVGSAPAGGVLARPVA